MSKSAETKKKPILNVAQLLIIAVVVILFVLRLSIQATRGGNQSLSAEEAALAVRVAEERERNRQLLITATYVSSDDYVADYARDEGGMILPGEKRVVPMPNPLPPTPTPIPTPLPPVTLPETPFEAWWMLFFDSPPPGK